TTEIDETTCVNGLRKRAHRRREFRRGNCGLAHGRLLWTAGSMVRTVEPEVARASRALWASAHKLLTLYDGEQTIQPLHYYHDDIDYYARLRNSFLEVLGVLQESD